MVDKISRGYGRDVKNRGVVVESVTGLRNCEASGSRLPAQVALAHMPVPRR